MWAVVFGNRHLIFVNDIHFIVNVWARLEGVIVVYNQPKTLLFQMYAMLKNAAALLPIPNSRN